MVWNLTLFYAIRPTLDKVIGRFSKLVKEAKNMESVSDFLADLKETESNCTSYSLITMRTYPRSLVPV